MAVIIHKEGSSNPYKSMKGIYYNADVVHELVDGGEIVSSNPPSGKYKIINIYWDDDLQKVVIEKQTEPEK